MTLFVIDFLINQFGWTLNLVMAHVLFWVYAFEDLKTYGYKNTINPEIGNIPSGSLGSGVVVIATSLMIVMTLIWLDKLWNHEVGKAKDIGIGEDEDDSLE